MNYHALFALFMGCFEVFICGGVNTGWPAIIKLLQQEEYFSSECEDAEPCLLQSQKFNLVYTLLTSIGGATALLGWWKQRGAENEGFHDNADAHRVFHRVHEL